MKHTLKIFLVLVAAWSIDQPTPRAEGVAFTVDRDTVGTSVWDRSASGGRSAQDFLTRDGRFDLEAIRASGYQGPLDLKGLNVGTDPRTGEPVLAPANAKIAGDPDDTFWTDKFSCVAGLDGPCCALCVYDGKLIAGVLRSELHAGGKCCVLGRFLMVPFRVGDGLYCLRSDGL